MTAEPLTVEQMLLAMAEAVYSADEGTQGYVLPDKVRLPCPNFWQPAGAHDAHCPRCQGRNWLPSPDPFAWRKAFRGIVAEIYIRSLPTFAGDIVEVWLDGISFAVDPGEGLRALLQNPYSQASLGTEP